MSEPQQTNQPSPDSTQQNAQEPESPYSPSQQPENLSRELADNVAFVLGHTPAPKAPDLGPRVPLVTGGGMPPTAGSATGQAPYPPSPDQEPSGSLPLTTVSGPPGTPPPSKSKKKTGLLVGLVAGVALLGLLAVFLIVPWLKNTAERAVTNYLQALASGNADEALSYAKDKPSDLTFLTSDHLKKSNELAAITDITVDAAGTRQPTAVTAHYKIGAEEVTAVFGVTKIDDVWKMNQVAKNVDFDPKWADSGLTIRLNDQAITRTSVYLFPGTYQVSTGHKYVTVGDTTLHVKDPSSPVTTALTASLTDEGKSAVLEAAKARWQSCLAEKKMWPSGCGFVGSSPDYPIKESSVKWSQTKAPIPIEDASVALSDTNPMQAAGSFNARAHLYVEFSSVSGHGWIDWDVTSFTADLSQEAVTVAFDLGDRVD